MPRDSSESDLVDSTSYRAYGFIQTPSAFKRFYSYIGYILFIRIVDTIDFVKGQVRNPH